MGPRSSSRLVGQRTTWQVYGSSHAWISVDPSTFTERGCLLDGLSEYIKYICQWTASQGGQSVHCLHFQSALVLENWFNDRHNSGMWSVNFILFSVYELRNSQVFIIESYSYHNFYFKYKNSYVAHVPLCCGRDNKCLHLDAWRGVSS